MTRVRASGRWTSTPRRRARRFERDLRGAGAPRRSGAPARRHRRHARQVPLERERADADTPVVDKAARLRTTRTRRLDGSGAERSLETRLRGASRGASSPARRRLETTSRGRWTRGASAYASARDRVPKDVAARAGSDQLAILSPTSARGVTLRGNARRRVQCRPRHSSGLHKTTATTRCGASRATRDERRRRSERSGCARATQAATSPRCRPRSPEADGTYRISGTVDARWITKVGVADFGELLFATVDAVDRHERVTSLSCSPPTATRIRARRCSRRVDLATAAATARRAAQNKRR